MADGIRPEVQAGENGQDLGPSVRWPEGSEIVGEEPASSPDELGGEGRLPRARLPRQDDGAPADIDGARVQRQEVSALVQEHRKCRLQQEEAHRRLARA